MIRENFWMVQIWDTLMYRMVQKSLPPHLKLYQINISKRNFGDVYRTTLANFGTPQNFCPSWGGAKDPNFFSRGQLCLCDTLIRKGYNKERTFLVHTACQNLHC